MGDCERRIAEIFKMYDDVFEALTESRSPEPFRRFLIDGPRFSPGSASGWGASSSWSASGSHQFPGRKTRHLSPEAVVDGLRNLTAALSLGAGATGADHPPTERIWGPEIIRAKPVLKRKTLKAVG